jgi:hypothetical protein
MNRRASDAPALRTKGGYPPRTGSCESHGVGILIRRACRAGPSTIGGEVGRVSRRGGERGPLLGVRMQAHTEDGLRDARVPRHPEVSMAGRRQLGIIQRT